MGSSDTNRVDFGPQPTAFLIAATPRGEQLGQEAIAATAARLVGAAGISDAVVTLATNPAPDVILVEAAGAADADALSDALAGIESLTLDTGLAIIVTLDPSQIDLVTAQLLTGRVQLLCDPSHVERVAALAVALADKAPLRLRERDTDTESVRLRRLNEEVARIAETLVRLTRDSTAAGSDRRVEDRTPGFRPGPDEARPVSASEIRQAIRARRLRDQYLGAGLFEDPAWDMLLDLFAAELERAQVSVSSLCIAAAVAPTTALRWIGRLTEAGLLAREPDPFDRRRAFMVLSDRAREGMQGYCSAVKRAGGAIG